MSGDSVQHPEYTLCDPCSHAAGHAVHHQAPACPGDRVYPFTREELEALRPKARAIGISADERILDASVYDRLLATAKQGLEVQRKIDQHADKGSSRFCRMADERIGELLGRVDELERAAVERGVRETTEDTERLDWLNSVAREPGIPPHIHIRAMRGGATITVAVERWDGASRVDGEDIRAAIDAACKSDTARSGRRDTEKA